MTSRVLPGGEGAAEGERGGGSVDRAEPAALAPPVVPGASPTTGSGLASFSSVGAREGGLDGSVFGGFPSRTSLEAGLMTPLAIALRKARGR